MTLLERLKKLLEHDDLTQCPDYKDCLDHLALSDEDDPELIRDIVKEEIASLEAMEPEAEPEGEESDVR